MKQINSAFFNYLTPELTGMADDDDLVKKYWETDSNDPEIMKGIIETVLKPRFDSYSTLFKQKTKDCLGYYLATDKINFERAYDSYLLPIETPADPKLFFEWIW